MPATVRWESQGNVRMTSVMSDSAILLSQSELTLFTLKIIGYLTTLEICCILLQV